MKRTSNSKTKHTINTPNSQKSPPKLTGSSKKISKPNNRYTNPSFISIKTPIASAPILPYNPINYIKTIYNPSSPISTTNYQLNTQRINTQTPNYASKVFYLKNKFSNQKSLSNPLKGNSLNEINDTTAYKENLHPNQPAIHSVIVNDKKNIQNLTGTINYQHQSFDKLDNRFSGFIARSTTSRDQYPGLPINPISENIEGTNSNSNSITRTALKLNEEKTDNSPSDSLKTKSIARTDSALKLDLNSPKLVGNTTRKTLSIGSNETANNLHTDTSTNSTISNCTHGSLMKKYHTKNSISYAQNPSLHNHSNGHDSNPSEGMSYRKSYGSSERGTNNLQVMPEERCSNHPYKKAKYVKVIIEGGREISPGKYCSKCAIALAGQGLKMKEIIASEAALRKAEIEEFLIYLATAKRNVTYSMESFMRKKENIITFYLKQAEKADFIYNAIHKLLLDEKLKSLDILNQSKDDILSEIKKYQDQSESILEEVNNIQNDIEQNIEKIVKNIAIEPFQDIMNRYKKKVQTYDAFINQIKNHSLILNKLPSLKKGILDNINTIIMSLYTNIKTTTSLLKRGNMNNECPSEDPSRKNSEDVNNGLNKSSLYISFDNKEIFENAIMSTKEDDSIKKALANLTSKSIPEVSSFIINKNKDNEIRTETQKSSNILPNLNNINRQVKGNTAISAQIRDNDSSNNEFIIEDNTKNQQRHQILDDFNEKNQTQLEEINTPFNLPMPSDIIKNDNKNMKIKLNLEDLLKYKNMKFDNFLTTKSNRPRSTRRNKSFLSFENYDNQNRYNSLHNKPNKTYQYIPSYKLMDASNLIYDKDTNLLDDNNNHNYINNGDNANNHDQNDIENYIHNRIKKASYHYSSNSNPGSNSNPNPNGNDNGNGNNEYINSKNKRKYMNILDKINANQSHKNNYYSRMIKNNPLISSRYIQTDCLHTSAETPLNTIPKTTTTTLQIDKPNEIKQYNKELALNKTIANDNTNNDKILHGTLFYHHNYQKPPKSSSKIFSSAEENNLGTARNKNSLNNLSADAKIEGLTDQKDLMNYENFIMSLGVNNLNLLEDNTNNTNQITSSISSYQKHLFCSPNFKDNIEIQSTIS